MSSAATMRAVIITESLIDRTPPTGFQYLAVHRYPHDLDGQTPIEICEVTVPAAQAPELALALARALEPRLYYAHLIDEQRMLIAFPHTVVTVDRDNEAAIEHARDVGALFEIPADQMRFAEMWDTDHPDAPSAQTGSA
ncbi:hypothetical protein BX286_0835 [Streptomyces sp. 3211.6]|uniref:hypothetical protein n=1 Tax=Streptomyces sp. 3211.6 TaxID=1938845 RepID=UPI000F11047B|nr:hypothetical protein [Streptomyces sp. 3211.6]RKT02922.1 hypothetical protein BX286_0835 [Streptomyces sp. 3211.6]